MTAYPGAIDSFINPTASESTNSPSHAGQHTNANEAIEALETALGITGAFNFAPTLRLIYVDELGADPTGVSDSSAVIRAKQTALGSAAYQLVLGAGTYLMNSAFVNFGPNQGVKGVGSPFTSISWSGSGSLITATATSFVNSARAGAFGGFQIDGPFGSSTTSGISYTNLQSMIVDDVAFYGLPGGAILGLTSSIGGYAEEGQLTRLSMSECGAQSGFVMNFNGVSFDYTKIDAVVVVEGNIDVLSVNGNGQMQGLDLSLRGNCHAPAGANTGAIIAIERGNASGTGYLINAHFDVSMEANDLLGGTAGHYLYWNGSHNAASQFSAEGTFMLYNAGAACQGGVGGGGAFNTYFNPASFVGISNALNGGGVYPGNALSVMGGSGWSTGNVASSTTVYWQFADVATIALASGAQTLTFNGADSFIRRVELLLTQPASGADGTVTWPSSVKWPGGTPPTLSTVNGYVDKLKFTYIPTTGFWYGELIGVHYA